jgi:hypothetical protein
MKNVLAENGLTTEGVMARMTMFGAYDASQLGK